MSRLPVEPTPLAAVLLEARALLARPGNDFCWSSWDDEADALAEIDRLLDRPVADSAILFAPTGPLQEVAMSSGWGDEFLALADRFDALPTVFACSLCGKQAGSIALSAGELRRESFTSVLTQAGASAEIRAAVARADAAAVHALDPELAPFYCPACGASYCGDHWERWDVFDEDDPTWHDSIRGRCPEGHERLLED